MKFIDLTGRRFGRLLVIKWIGRKNNSSVWLCLCDCGNEKIISSSNLGRSTKSCGCLNKELTIKRNKIKTNWTESEEDILKEFYENNGIKFCFNKLKKSPEQIRSKASSLGLKIKNKLPHKIISIIDGETALACCPIHEICEHRIKKENNRLRCRLCDSEYNKKRNNLEEVKIKRRIWKKKRNSTPLGKYETRLRARLRRLSKNELSFSKNLPYNSKQLCNHLEFVRSNQNNCCPLCNISYEINPADMEHIIPTSTAKTREELLKLFYLNNLSLLCYKCNRYFKRCRTDVKYNTGFKNVY